MIPNHWINIYEVLKNGEKDSIEMNGYSTTSGLFITSNFIDQDRRKQKSLSGYTIGLKYLLNNYDINNNRENSPVTIARKYLKMPVQITNNTRLEEFIQPIQADKNYVFYFPYYTIDDPRIEIENGSYSVAPVQDEDGGNILTFPPNVTLVFDPGAFLKLGGTVFDIRQRVPSQDYEITSYDINKNRLLLKKEEFLWIDIQGEVHASPYPIFKVWNIEYANFGNHPHSYLKDVDEQITWIQSLGVVRGPRKNKILYPEWWGAADHPSYSVHIGQVFTSPHNVLDSAIENGDLENFYGSGIRDLEFRPMTADQIAIQSCIDASQENQEIYFTKDYVIHQIKIRPNRKYISHQSVLQRPNEYSVYNKIKYIDENNVNSSFFDQSQKVYLINLLYSILWKHLNRFHEIRDRDTLQRTTVNLHFKVAQKRTETEKETIPQNLQTRGVLKQFVKNSEFISTEDENRGNEMFINSTEAGTKNRRHLYGVSADTRIEDLKKSLVEHMKENHQENIVIIRDEEYNRLSWNGKLIYLIKKYQEHLQFHINFEEIHPSNLDSNHTSIPEIELHEFIGWRSNLADGDLFSLELHPNEIQDIHKHYTAIIQGFTFFNNLSRSGIYDGFNVEHNASIRLHNSFEIKEEGETGLKKQCHVFISNCNFVGSIGDAIGITSNINASISNNFFSDCWRGAFSVSGGGNTIFCQNLMNQDQNLRVQYNKMNSNEIGNVPAYTGIESENTKSSKGIENDSRMQMFLNNAYMSGNFDFTFFPNSRILMSNMISDQSLWKIFFDNPLSDPATHLEGPNSAQANVRMCDSIFTVSGYAGASADGTSGLSLRRFGSFYGDQLFFKSRKNPLQVLLNKKIDQMYYFIGILINRRIITDEDALYDCRIYFQHCQVYVNPGDYEEYQRVAGMSLVTSVHNKEFKINKNESLIVVSKLILNPKINVGFAFDNNIQKSVFFSSDNDFIKLEKCYLPTFADIVMDTDVAPVENREDYQPCNLILNGNDSPWIPNTYIDMVFKKTKTHESSLLPLQKMVLVVQNTVSDVSRINFFESVSFHALSNRFIDSRTAGNGERPTENIPLEFNGMNDIPLLAGLQGDTLWRRGTIEAQDPISWICFSTGDMDSEEDDSIPKAQWNVYFRKR